jgi:hypothetical protein
MQQKFGAFSRPYFCIVILKICIMRPVIGVRRAADHTTPVSGNGPHPDIQMRNVVVGGDVKVGNVRTGDILGDSVNQGDANTQGKQCRRCGDEQKNRN